MVRFKSFLEIGCGTGFVLSGVSRRFQEATLYGTEYLAEGLHYARQKVPSAHLHQLNALQMQDHLKYEAIGAFDVLEHIDDDVRVLSNLSNALMIGGSLLITVPQHNWLWSVTDVYACHARRYTREELCSKISSCGLEVNYVTSFVFFLLPLMYIQRMTLKKKKFDPAKEFLVSPIINWILAKIMTFEKLLIKLGVSFPVGGSLLIVAKKTHDSI